MWFIQKKESHVSFQTSSEFHSKLCLTPFPLLFMAEHWTDSGDILHPRSGRGQGIPANKALKFHANAALTGQGMSYCHDSFIHVTMCLHQFSWGLSRWQKDIRALWDDMCFYAMQWRRYETGTWALVRKLNISSQPYFHYLKIPVHSRIWLSILRQSKPCFLQALSLLYPGR